MGETRREPGTMVDFPRGNETVLIVEDEEKVRELTSRVLKTQGDDGLEASEGREGLLIAQGHKGPIHLLIADVVMPRMSGREVAERIVAVHPEIKILYMSGYNEHAI